MALLLREKNDRKGLGELETWRIVDLERGGGVEAERGGRNIMVRLVCAIEKIECLKGI